MYRAMQNLLSNAITYAETKVEVSINLEQQGIVILIEDDGTGIPEDQQHAIFDPFVKLEKKPQSSARQFWFRFSYNKKSNGLAPSRYKV